MTQVMESQAKTYIIANDSTQAKVKLMKLGLVMMMILLLGLSLSSMEQAFSLSLSHEQSTHDTACPAASEQPISSSHHGTPHASGAHTVLCFAGCSALPNDALSFVWALPSFSWLPSELIPNSPVFLLLPLRPPVA
jgi:hypothetical protein